MFNKILVPYIICDKCDSNNNRILTEEESIQILKILGLTNNIAEHQIKIID